MRVDTVTIKGLLRFAEATTFDLRELTGLVAVVGANGEGKTTALEAALACLYRVFPTRADKELFDYASAPDAFIETTFELEGRGTYRARVLVDGPHRKSDAVLSRLEADGRITPLTDGKVSTYDAAIAELLPPLSTLLASVFSAQNRTGSFATLDKKGRKQLFTSLLGLSDYEAWAARASAAATTSSQEAEKVAIRLEAIDVNASPTHLAAAQGAVDGLADAVASAGRQRAALATAIGQAEAAHAEHQDAAAAHASASARIDAKDAEQRSAAAEHGTALEMVRRVQVEAEQEVARLEAAATEDIENIDRRIARTDTLDGELAAIDTQLAVDLADVAERIANNRKVIEAGNDIAAAVARLGQIDTTLADLRQRVGAMNAEIRRITAEQAGVVMERSRLERTRQQLERAASDAALLAQVPCRGDGAFATCQFLVKASAAATEAEGLAAVQAQLADVAASYDRMGAEIRAQEASLEQAQARVGELEAERGGVERTAKRHTDLEMAAERIKGHEARRTDLQATAERQRQEARARETERRAAHVRERERRVGQRQKDRDALARRTATTIEEWKGRADVLAQRITALNFELANLREEAAATADASRLADEASATLTALREDWDTSTRELTRLQHEHAQATERLTAIRARQAERAALQAELEQHRTDAAEWQVLTKALGRDGLPTLEIDAAGPTVSAFCNDLLQSCFGARFSVDLVTQEAKAGKSKDGQAFKEVFELHVYDAERPGEQRDLADLSGGEQVLVEEALKSAIALLVNTRNQHPVRTCWRDETTGALDGDNAARYVDMLRRVQSLGGFAHLLYVTHNPDAAAGADAQLVVGGGRIELRHAPFRAAA